MLRTHSRAHTMQAKEKLARLFPARLFVGCDESNFFRSKQHTTKTSEQKNSRAE